MVCLMYTSSEVGRVELLNSWFSVLQEMLDMVRNHQVRACSCIWVLTIDAGVLNAPEVVHVWSC